MLLNIIQCTGWPPQCFPDCAWWCQAVTAMTWLPTYLATSNSDTHWFGNAKVKTYGLRVGELSTRPASTPKSLHLQWLTPLPSFLGGIICTIVNFTVFGQNPMFVPIVSVRPILVDVSSPSLDQEPLKNWIFYLYLGLLCLGSSEE